MSYYDKNKKKLLKKAYEKYHNKGGKEKAPLYYQKNKERTKKGKGIDIIRWQI